MDDQNTGITTVTLPVIKYKTGTEVNLQLIGDTHLGASFTNEWRIKWDLERAKQNNARININGDVLDLILPKDIGRYKPSVVAEPLRGRDDLINRLIDYAYNFFAPYAHLIDVIGEGNHEVAIRKWHSIDVLAILIDKLNQLPNTHIHFGGYTGFIKYRFEWDCESRSRGKEFIIFRKHGKGSSAEVTEGMIEFQREASIVEDMDLIWLSHNHYRNMKVGVKMRMNHFGNRDFSEYRCVRTGAYAFHSEDSYQVEKGYRPQAHGGAWVRIWLNRDKKIIEVGQ